jgi:S-adenosylmethionine/arginine decarboxylase-like enzyme
MKPWGWTTMIDASGCDRERITSEANFQAFIDELLEKIEMVKIGDLNIHWCETNDPKKYGHSIYQLLQDSNVSAHFCPEDGNQAYVDIFSCKEYDEVMVLDIFDKYFLPNAFNSQTFERRAPGK